MRTVALFSGILLCLATLSAWAIEHDEKLADPAQQAVFDHLTNEVRCLVCQNQTIADSTAPLAIDLRREIRQMLEAGRSEEEIKTFLLDRYGDFVLYRPRWQANTALLWLAPVLLLLIGAGGLWRIIRRRAALPVPSEDGDPPSAG
ncbi:MAG: cytochrome c-type biogenesis protein CcmH [Gammaproteobacteria bacterium]|nr:cytochrome c-type biogenesis protein CcmH [Gammaproteobacteria bacterium]MCP5138663.1 cytochrome c-type biogenesis protein CcmH [Chromatiales bacterium]